MSGPFDERSWRSRSRASVSRVLVDCGDIGGDAGAHVKELLHGGRLAGAAAGAPASVGRLGSLARSRREEMRPRLGQIALRGGAAYVTACAVCVGGGEVIRISLD